MTRTAMRAFGTSDRTGHDSSGFYKRKMYTQNRQNIDVEQWQENECDENVINRIYNHSSIDMNELPDNSVHLMVTSPPYNVGKEYDDDLTEDEFSKLLASVWSEVYRVLIPGGRACVNIANLGRKPYVPLNSMICQQMGI